MSSFVIRNPYRVIALCESVGARFRFGFPTVQQLLFSKSKLVHHCFFGSFVCGFGA